LEKIIIFN